LRFKYLGLSFGIYYFKLLTLNFEL
jgi:hypothetical protein